MILAARGGALVVAAATSHALGTPCRAHVVWEGKGELGHVGLLVVAAEASVVKLNGVAGVDERGASAGLEADSWAAAALVIAPSHCTRRHVSSCSDLGSGASSTYSFETEGRW